MALLQQGSLDDNKVRFYFDVVSNRVVGLRLENDSARTVRVTITRATSGNTVHTEDVLPVTVAVRSIPSNRRFDYDDALADWGYSLQQIG